MDKEIEKKEKQAAQENVYIPSDDNEEAQNSLEGGIIPEDFKRQMFYTLADYKDILDGKNIVVDLLSGSSGSDKEMVEREQNIKTAIESVFKPSGSSPPPEKKPVQTPESWWTKHGKDIWKGMICALTYKTDTASGTAPTQINKVKEALLQEGKNTLKDTYTYDKVTFQGGFDENDGTGLMKQDAPPSPETKLEKFVKRPTFVRWLEEWGDEFCRKRTHKLDIIEKECYKDGDKNCSGDGLKCKEKVPDNKDIFMYFNCPRCSTPCGFYKRWIRSKKDEFEKLKGRYTNEISNVDNNNRDNGFYTKLKETCTTAGEFLDNLKGKPCKSNENRTNDINFKENDSKTFKHTEYCDPCAQFTVKCQKDKCRGDGTKVTCDGKTPIDAKDIESMKTITQHVVMLVSDDSQKEFAPGLEACINAGIFKGIKENKWSCRNVCGVDICTLKKTNNNVQVKEHIIMKEFLKRWLENFFEDYNKINKKLKTCTKSGKGSKCIKECVDEWIKLKKGEWDKINEKYIDTYNIEDGGNDLKTFLEELIPRINLTNDKGKITKLSHLDGSNGCNCTKNSKKENGNEDAVQCLLKNLGNEAKKCEQKHQTSGNPQQPCQESPSVEDDEAIEEEDQTPDEAKKMIPKICGDMGPTQQQDEGDECKPAAVPGNTITENEEDKPKADDEASGEGSSDSVETPAGESEEKPAQDKSADPPTPDPEAPSSLPPADQPFDPTILQTTIPFGVALALGSIAFLFLK
ncbi:hypothetical protein PFMC_06050, partial [Plasmodium falciparum CAMP/Malaysia]